MKIVFFGTPEYVLPVLNDLHHQFKNKSHTSPVTAIVTQEPKPAGRKKQLQFSPVDTWGHKRKIPVFFNPKDIITNKVEADIASWHHMEKLFPKKSLIISLMEFLTSTPHSCRNGEVLPLFKQQS